MIGHYGATLALFVAFVLITLGITIWARVNTRGADDFYAGGRTFSGPQNGVALAGDYMSAASFLGIAGPHRAVRLRRVPVLDRLPRRVAARAAAGRD